MQCGQTDINHSKTNLSILKQYPPRIIKNGRGLQPAPPAPSLLFPFYIFSRPHPAGFLSAGGMPRCLRRYPSCDMYFALASVFSCW